VSSLCRGHANLLCIVPIFSYASPKGAIDLGQNWSWQLEILILYGPRVWGARCHVTVGPSTIASHQRMRSTNANLTFMSLFQIHPPHSVILSQYSYFTINTLFPLSLHTTRLSNSPRSEHGPNLTLESRAVRRTHPAHAAHHLPARPSQALPGKCFVCAFAQLLSHVLISSVQSKTDYF
jgi:hypothetical protein